MPSPRKAAKIDPSALQPQDVARIMSAASGRAITAVMVQDAVDAGAPATADGRINLVQFMAWLEKEMASR